MFGQYQFDPAGEFESGIYQQARRKPGFLFATSWKRSPELIAEGKVRYIGLSNEQPWGVMEFVHIAREYDLPLIAVCKTAIT